MNNVFDFLFIHGILVILCLFFFLFFQQYNWTTRHADTANTVYTRWQNSYNVIVSVFLKARLQIMTSAVSHYIILQVNLHITSKLHITSNNWIRSPSAFKSLIGLVLVFFRRRELELLLLPLKIRVHVVVLFEGRVFFLFQSYGCSVVFIFSYSKLCVFFCRGPISKGKKKGGGDVIKSERKKSNNNNRSKKVFLSSGRTGKLLCVHFSYI